MVEDEGGSQGGVDWLQRRHPVVEVGSEREEGGVDEIMDPAGLVQGGCWGGSSKLA